MIKVHGMTSAMEMGGEGEAVRDVSDARLESPDVHGMTETLRLDAGEERRSDPGLAAPPPSHLARAAAKPSVMRRVASGFGLLGLLAAGAWAAMEAGRALERRRRWF